MEEARRLRASALVALASATRLARIWAYSFYEKSQQKPKRQQLELGVRTASSLTFSDWRRLSAMRWRLCCRRWGVIKRWILGALV